MATEVDCDLSSSTERCSPPHIVAGIEDVIIHPDHIFTRNKHKADIALLRMNISVPLTSKTYLCINCQSCNIISEDEDELKLF